MERTKTAIWYAMAVLFFINALNFFDRIVLSAVGEPIRKELLLGDTSLGLLSTAFTLLYAFVGVPLGRLADRISRRKILSVGVFIWSLLTLGSGLAQNFVQLFLMRLGVGVGEASCAPAATSLISDIFPEEKRARAMSVFMLGLPVGIALSFAISGAVAQRYGWRAAFLVAAIPGFAAAVLAWFISEPRRENGEAESPSRPSFGSAIYETIRKPVMLWLIASGAIHNFCLYALSSFMTPYLMRYHGLKIGDASLIAMVVNGIFTLPGLLLGGYLGDISKRWRADGSLLVVAGACLAAVPLFIAAILAEKGSTTLFLIAMGSAFALMYFYYSITYAAISDVTEPRSRGTAMSVYFMAMYLLGGALGPYVVGAISDHFARKAASLAGVTEMTQAALEPFRGAGLHSALFVVPVLCVALAGVMVMAARSYRKKA